MNMRPISRNLILSYVAIAGIFMLPAPADAKEMPDSYQLFYNTNFASGFGSCEVREAGKNELSIVAAPGNPEKKVAKIELHREGDLSRAEVSLANCSKIKNGRDYMITFSTYMPPDYLVDSRQSEKIVEIHQGTGSGPAPFSLSISGDKYVADLHNGTNGKHYVLGPAGSTMQKSGDKGYWIKWALHYRPDPTGARADTDLYKNSVLVMSADGVPNAYANDDNAYFKMGITKHWSGAQASAVSDRVMYFGDVAIGARP